MRAPNSSSIRPFEAHAAFGCLVVDHPVGGDPPARLGAAFGLDHRAGGVGGVGQHDLAIRVRAWPLNGRQPPAFAQGEQQVAHRPGIELSVSST
jgi:hypothetical protein